VTQTMLGEEYRS